MISYNIFIILTVFKSYTILKYFLLKFIKNVKESIQNWTQCDLNPPHRNRISSKYSVLYETIYVSLKIT